MSGNRSHTKGTDDRSDSEGTAEKEADSDKGYIHEDSYDAEFFLCLVADHYGNEIVWSGSGFGFDDDGHAVSKNHASKRQHQDFENQRIRNGENRCKYHGKDIDDRSAEDHAENGADFYIPFIDRQQSKNDQKADDDMYTAVGDKGPWEKVSDGAENSLNQYIEGIGT